MYLCTPGCITLSPVLQDFVEHCMMQTRGCQMSSSHMYFDTYWYKPVHTWYILVHTWSVLSMYKDIPRMMLLCCTCAGYWTGCSTIFLLHREDSHDFALEDCWTARPQLFFSCHLHPKDGRLPKTREGCKGDRA